MYGEYAWGYTSVGPFQLRQIREGRHPFYPPYPSIASFERPKPLADSGFSRWPCTAIERVPERGMVGPPYPFNGYDQGRKAMAEVEAPQTPPTVFRSNEYERPAAQERHHLGEHPVKTIDSSFSRNPPPSGLLDSLERLAIQEETHSDTETVVDGENALLDDTGRPDSDDGDGDQESDKARIAILEAEVQLLRLEVAQTRRRAENS